MIQLREPGTAGASAELLALYSLKFGCRSADRNVDELVVEIHPTRAKAFLEESLFFHHFMAMSAVSHCFQNKESRLAYCDSMVEAISSRSGFPSNEDMDLPPSTHFSATDQEDVIERCFSAVGNVNAPLREGLYIQREPSVSELEIMNLSSVRQMTDWDSPSANTVPYFTAAFLARLAISLEIEPQKRFSDFINLGIYAGAESVAAFELYMDLLGFRVLVKNDSIPAAKIVKSRGKWLSKLFK